MKQYYLAFLLFFLSTIGFSQVKIGGTDNTPNKDALLEIEGNKGLLLPRLALKNTNDKSPLSAHVEGMTVYNTAKTGNVTPGFYYNDGAKWIKMVTTDDKVVNFFYMPSISFDTSVDRNGQIKDLYAEYKKQFSLSGNKVASAGAPTSGIPYFEKATDLYYYITEYDTNVFKNVTISADGKMKYDVKKTATDCSFINIVFVVK